MKVAELRNPSTGEFTTDGEAILRGIFALSSTSAADVGGEGCATAETNSSTEAAKVAQLEQQVAQLLQQLETLAAERDFLRLTLEREQQLHGIALSKIPAQLTGAERDHEQRRGLGAIWARLRKGKTE